MTRIVYFATSRKATPGGADFDTDLDPAGIVHFGKAEAPDLKQTDNIDVPVAISRLSTGSFWPDLQQDILKSSNLLLFVHGFNFKFNEVIAQAGKLAAWYGAGKPAVTQTVICFDWPSLGELLLYGSDFLRASGAGDAFRQFLRAMIPITENFRAADPNRKVTLLAHSMGNHALRVGLYSALGTSPGQYDAAAKPPVFDRVVLAAADEDADALSHTDKLAPLAWLADRVYVYYNNGDLPLRDASSVLHLSGRLGIDGPPDKSSFVGTNFVFVNCSAATDKDSTGAALDPEGHQYYRVTPEVRDDICNVMAGRTDDANFPNREYRPEGNFYRLDMASQGPKKKDYSRLPGVPTIGPTPPPVTTPKASGV